MSVEGSRLGVLLVESVFKLKVVLTVSLILNTFFVFSAVLSSLYFGFVWGFVFALVALIINCFVVIKTARGFQYEELIKNG